MRPAGGVGDVPLFLGVGGSAAAGGMRHQLGEYGDMRVREGRIQLGLR